MGLEDGDEARRLELAQGGEGSADLGRVVGVIVIYADVAAPALQLESAADTGEVGERRRGCVGIEAGGARGRQAQRGR